MLASARPMRAESPVRVVNVEMGNDERATLLSTARSPTTVQNAGANNSGYEVKEELGHGGFGVVHKIVETSTGRVMARKLVLLPPKKEDNARTVFKIQQELHILSSCNCENIVAFYGSHSDNYSLCIFMELMDMSLDDMIIRVGLVPEKHLTWIAKNVLNAVRYLKAEHRVLHRDLKPANILVNAAGEVKLCDLGVCATLSLMKSTASAACIATRTYLSPECLSGKGSNLLSEVWSIGIILQEAAVGRYPIPHLTKSDVAVVEKKLFLISHGEWKRLTAVQEKWRKVYRQRPNAIPLLELMVQVSTPPTLPEGLFGEDFRDFTSRCLKVARSERASVDELLSHAFLHQLNDLRDESQAGFRDFVNIASNQALTTTESTFSRTSIRQLFASLLGRTND